jgi:hypothetical protein
LELFKSLGVLMLISENAHGSIMACQRRLRVAYPANLIPGHLLEPVAGMMKSNMREINSGGRDSMVYLVGTKLPGIVYEPQ